MDRLIKSYSELVTLESWEERFAYLRLYNQVHESPHFLNHEIYKTTLWRNFKRDMHTRDYGCDLGVLGVGIEGPMILHHINPVTIEDIETFNEFVLLNPDNVITTSYKTHNRVHYLLEETNPYTERQPGDTKLW